MPSGGFQNCTRFATLDLQTRAEGGKMICAQCLYYFHLFPHMCICLCLLCCPLLNLAVMSS